MHALAAGAIVLLAASSWLIDLKVRLKNAPDDVEAFVVRHASCNHFLGEPRFNQERAAFLDRTIRELRCDSLPQEREQLRRVHRDDRAALRLLDEADGLGPW
jgi:hypothetical protein